MFRTYEFFKSSINVEDLKGLTINELIKGYKEAKSEYKRSKYFAAIFLDLFPMIFKIQKTFVTISNEQKVESCMNVLYKNLNKYRLGDKKTKFTSYFYGNYRRNLIGIKNRNSKHLNKKVWENLVQCNDEKVFNYLIDSINKANNNSEFDIHIFNDNIDNSMLNSMERVYCKQVVQGYTKAKDLSKYMFLGTGLPYTKIRSKINKIRKGLREKLIANNYDLFFN